MFLSRTHSPLVHICIVCAIPLQAGSNRHIYMSMSMPILPPFGIRHVLSCRRILGHSFRPPIRIDPHPTAVITVINSDTHIHRPHLLCFGCRWSAGPQFRCHSWPPPLPTMWPCDFRPGRWLKEALTQVVGAAVTLPLTPRWVERPTKTD